MARCHSHVVTDDFGNPRANATPSGYSPSDLRSAYKVTASGSSSTTIAIVDAFGYTNAESDLATYRAQFGLPACQHLAHGLGVALPPVDLAQVLDRLGQDAQWVALGVRLDEQAVGESLPPRISR